MNLGALYLSEGLLSIFDVVGTLHSSSTFVSTEWSTQGHKHLSHARLPWWKFPYTLQSFWTRNLYFFSHWDSAVNFHCAKHDRNSCETQWPCWDLNTQTMRKMSLGPSGAHQDVTFSGAPRTCKHRAAVLFYVWPAINDSTCAQTAASVQAIVLYELVRSYQHLWALCKHILCVI